MDKQFLIWQHDWLNETSCPFSPTQRLFLSQQSLTQALKSLGLPFSVRVLHLGESATDVWLSDRVAPQYGFVRDVVLCLQDKPVVWARSRCTLTNGVWQDLLNCGTQPLGERLFDGSLPLQRSPFEYAIGLSKQPLYGFAGEALAARRSVFTLAGASLGLVECFLPALLPYLADLRNENRE